ncbi:MAG: hypothetical protein HZR80_18855 [Candidatus Heimdallarchaeota archaeon]
MIERIAKKKSFFVIIIFIIFLQIIASQSVAGYQYTPKKTWEITPSGYTNLILSNLVIKDINNDNIEEILYFTDNSLCCYTIEGELLWSIDLSFEHFTQSQPIVVDLNDDLLYEILISDGYSLNCFNSMRKKLWDYNYGLIVV